MMVAMYMPPVNQAVPGHGTTDWLPPPGFRGGWRG